MLPYLVATAAAVASCVVDVGLPEIRVDCLAPVTWGSDRTDYRATINIQNQSIPTFPAGCPYTEIEYLNLDGNEIATLPLTAAPPTTQATTTQQPIGVFLPAQQADTSTDLSKLRGINLARNRISVIYAGAFSGSPLLEEINLQNNRITFIQAAAFAGLSALLTLDLRWNRIHKFNYALLTAAVDVRGQSNGSPTCNSTDLHTAEVTCVTGVLACPETATVCSPTERPSGDYELRCFNFDHLPAAGAWTSTAIVNESIRLAHNNLSIVPHEGFKACPHTEATALYLNNNSITYVGGYAFLTLTRLETIDLSDNPVEYIARGALSGLAGLRTLLMRNMHLGIFDYQLLKGYHELAEVNLTNQLYGYADCEAKTAWHTHKSFISSLARCNPVEGACPGGAMGCVLGREPFALAGLEMQESPKADTVGTAGIAAVAIVAVGMLAGYAIHIRRQSLN